MWCPAATDVSASLPTFPLQSVESHLRVRHPNPKVHACPLGTTPRILLKPTVEMQAQAILRQCCAAFTVRGYGPAPLRHETSQWRESSSMKMYGHNDVPCRSMAPTQEPRQSKVRSLSTLLYFRRTKNPPTVCFAHVRTNPPTVHFRAPPRTSTTCR